MRRRKTQGCFLFLYPPSIKGTHSIGPVKRLAASDYSPTDPALRANPFPKVTDLFCRWIWIVMAPADFCSFSAFITAHNLQYIHTYIHGMHVCNVLRIV